MFVHRSHAAVALPPALGSSCTESMYPRHSLGPPVDGTHADYFRFEPFAVRSRSNRSAVRFFAAASAAFLARAVRCSGVIVSRLRLPPFEPIAAIACRSSSRDNLAMDSS